MRALCMTLTALAAVAGLASARRHAATEGCCASDKKGTYDSCIAGVLDAGTGVHGLVGHVATDMQANKSINWFGSHGTDVECSVVGWYARPCPATGKVYATAWIGDRCKTYELHRGADALPRACFGSAPGAAATEWVTSYRLDKVVDKMHVFRDPHRILHTAVSAKTCHPFFLFAKEPRKVGHAVGQEGAAGTAIRAAEYLHSTAEREGWLAMHTPLVRSGELAKAWEDRLAAGARSTCSAVSPLEAAGQQASTAAAVPLLDILDDFSAPADEDSAPGSHHRRKKYVAALMVNSSTKPDASIFKLPSWCSDERLQGEVL